MLQPALDPMNRHRRANISFALPEIFAIPRGDTEPKWSAPIWADFLDLRVVHGCHVPARPRREKTLAIRSVELRTEMIFVGEIFPPWFYGETSVPGCVYGWNLMDMVQCIKSISFLLVNTCTLIHIQWISIHYGNIHTKWLRSPQSCLHISWFSCLLINRYSYRILWMQDTHYPSSNMIFKSGLVQSPGVTKAREGWRTPILAEDRGGPALQQDVACKLDTWPEVKAKIKFDMYMYN